MKNYIKPLPKTKKNIYPKDVKEAIRWEYPDSSLYTEFILWSGESIRTDKFNVTLFLNNFSESEAITEAKRR